MPRSVFKCIDGHTCGNPVRVVAHGGPILHGANMAEKRRYFLKNFDWIRTGLMFEPRGHDMMSGSILYAPADPQNDIGILFIETSGCLPMCGHGAIGAVTIGIENELIKPRIPGQVRLETPAGVVLATYGVANNKVAWVQITNVASYLAFEDLEIHHTTFGKLKFDVAYGGNFYAIIDLQENFRGIEHYTAGALVQASPSVRQVINKAYPNNFQHPENPDICGVSHLLWAGTPQLEGSTARNAVFYGDKAIDRSPCGTGTSARMAQWYAKGKLAVGDAFIHESFIGSRFKGVVTRETRVGHNLAIIPSIQGWARVYGKNEIVIDTEDDPYALGFQVI